MRKVEFCIILRYELPLVLEFALIANKPYQKCPSQRVRKKLAVRVARITAFCSEVPGSNLTCQATIVLFGFPHLSQLLSPSLARCFNTSLRWSEKAETCRRLPI